MSIYKRVAGNLVIQTVGATDTVTFTGENGTANATAVIIEGDLTVNGNASLIGNISGDKIFSGTTSIEIPVASGNAVISVGGVSNIAIFTNQGIVATANIDVIGNISGGNISTGGSLSVTGNIGVGNIAATGNLVLSRSANISNPSVRFYDTDTSIADGQILGTLEWFIADSVPGPARVTSAIRSIANSVSGNANVQICTSTNGAAATPKVTVDNVGNVGIANTAAVHTLSVGGTTWIGATAQIVGNASVGNLSTAGQVSATGNVSAGNAIIGGLVTVTGNVNAGNASIGSTVNIGSGGLTATGNVRGGNIVSDGVASITGQLSAFDVISDGILSAVGNITGGNVSTTGVANVGVLIVNTSSSGGGIGVENTVRMNSDYTINADGSTLLMSNIGNLQFSALENQAYKFQAFLPVIPNGATLAEFAVLFSSGTCFYTVETQPTSSGPYDAVTSSTSDDIGTSTSMTGSDLRTVKIQGTFFNTANTTVVIRGLTQNEDVLIKTGAYLSYTRTY